MQPDMIHLHLQPDETRSHRPTTAMSDRGKIGRSVTNTVEDPAIVGIMGTVSQWLLWLVASYMAFSALAHTVHFAPWSKSTVYYVSMMAVVSLMATKKHGHAVLITASLVLITVTLMLML